MRVTDSMIFDSAARYIGEARERSEAASARASSGLRVQHPGDDPAAAGLLVIARGDAARFDQLKQGTDRATDQLGVMDSALDQVGNLLSRARELAVQLSNTTYSAAQRSGAADEVGGLLAQAISSLNAESGGRYLFGGNQDGAPPFDAAGNYAGDSGVRQLEIAPGVLQQVSLRVDQVVKGAGGRVDVLGTLSSLQSALASNNVTNVQGALTTLDTSISQIAAARSQLGAQLATVTTASQANALARDASTRQVSNLGDADAISTATDLALAQRALEASIDASSKSFQLTLLDRLPQ